MSDLRRRPRGVARLLALWLWGGALPACCFSNAPPEPEAIQLAAEGAVAPDVTPAQPAAPPPPPPAPTPDDLAGTAYDEGRYEDVCTHLVSRGVSSELCAWLAANAQTPGSGSLSVRSLERFLRAQHVRRVSGSIVGWYDQGNNEYEARIGGRTAILVATETAFQTTGRFSMWAQQHGSSEEVLNSGREVSVPIYREWPLYEAIRDVIAAHGDARRDAARTVLGLLLEQWELDFCHIESPDALGGGDCWVEAPPPPATPAADAPPVSAERRRECREIICFNFIECRRAGLPSYECSPDLTAECRRCRQEGAVR